VGSGNDQPIRRAHTITFGQTAKYSQGLKRARIEGSRPFRNRHRATGEGSVILHLQLEGSILDSSPKLMPESGGTEIIIPSTTGKLSVVTVTNYP
jgi:hypothetical protein